MKILLSSLMVLLALGKYSSIYAQSSNMVCYFANWARYYTGAGMYTVDNINPKLCTHMMYAFAVLNSTTYKIQIFDNWADIANNGYKKIVALKNQNPNLKVLISLGGWTDSNDGTGKYSQLVSSTSKINAFVSSAVTFLQQYNFDGMDLDWEVPSTPGEKVGYKNWIVALKNAFKPLGYLLSAAVPASATEIDAGYDVVTMNQNLDFINLMTYDFHGPSWEPKAADHHSPLHNRSGDTTNFNSDFAVNYWISKGMSANKINMGIPLYGVSWKLSSNSIAPPASATGAGAAGPITSNPGSMAYYEICAAVRSSGWQVVQDPSKAIGPYAVSPTSPKTWVGYDDPAMAMVKSNYILSKKLGGGMVWDISLDDFQNTCGAGVNPVITAIYNTLRNGSLSITTTTIKTSTQTDSSLTTKTTPKSISTTKPTSTRTQMYSTTQTSSGTKTLTTLTKLVTTTKRASTTPPVSSTTKSAATTKMAPTTNTMSSSTTMSSTSIKSAATTKRSSTTTKLSSVPTTNKFSGNFTCPTSNGLFPDPASCSNFYTCANGLATKMTCGTGLYFNPTFLVCDWPSNVQC